MVGSKMFNNVPMLTANTGANSNNSGKDYRSLRKEVRNRTLLELIRAFEAYTVVNQGIIKKIKEATIEKEVMELADSFESLTQQQKREALLLIAPYLVTINQNKLEELIISEYEHNTQASILALHHIIARDRAVRRLSDIVPLLYKTMKDDEFAIAFEAVFPFSYLVVKERPEFYIKALERDMESPMALDKKVCLMLAISYIIDFKPEKSLDAEFCYYLAEKCRSWLFNAFEEKDELKFHSNIIIGKALAKAYKKHCTDGKYMLTAFFSRYPEYKNDVVIEMIIDRMETLEQITGLVNWLKERYGSNMSDELIKYVQETFEIIKKKHIAALNIKSK